MVSEEYPVPRRKSSTSAFNGYRTRADAIVRQAEHEGLPLDEAHQQWEEARDLLIEQLTAVWLDRLAAIAKPGSYVHRAHFPSVTEQSGGDQPAGETGGR